MINENALVIYKTRPAVVKERAEGKYTIALADGGKVKVRDKDIELLHPGPVSDFSLINNENVNSDNAREIWELLCGDKDNAPSVSLKDLSVYIFNEYTPVSAYKTFCLLKDNLFFSGTISAITPRSREEVTSEESKRNEKERETGERALFLNSLKTCLKKTGAELPEDDAQKTQRARYLQDVEALAYGRTQRSRTIRDLGYSETPEDAHSLLLKTGFWSPMINPHPDRYGLSHNSAAVPPSLPPDEKRRDLTFLEAFAIDSPWSSDPDDAVSAEKTGDGKTFLYVHVADPAASVAFNSPAEIEARDRGVTFYLPEGAVRMLSDDFISMFALGLSEKSPALTFKMTMNENGSVTETEIFPSFVKVSRMTYEEADRLIDCASEDPQPEKFAQALCAIFDLSRKIFDRRCANGAVNIDLPDIHITTGGGNVTIEPIAGCKSASMVKECMIAAGEGTGDWAAERALAFPYISQEVELQGKILPGYAGAMQLRRCMRPRVLSVKPGRHQGLGLEIYTQVTSPLRRYTDLLAHIQIRAFLRGEKLLYAEDISSRLGFSEAASAAAVHAERASENHWKMVYLHQCLAGKKDLQLDAVAIENKGRFWHALIPSLALETQTVLQRDVFANDNIKLMLKSVNIAKGEAVFSQTG